MSPNRFERSQKPVGAGGVWSAFAALSVPAGDDDGAAGTAAGAASPLGWARAGGTAPMDSRTVRPTGAPVSRSLALSFFFMTSRGKVICRKKQFALWT